MNKKIEELLMYAELEGSEWGETVFALCQLAHYRDYVGDELRKALEDEITTQLEYVKDNSKIVESTTTITHTSRELEWYE